MYFKKTPDFLKPIYKDLIWDIPTSNKEVFITFDDGPVAPATHDALDILKEHNALATFFCIGDNVQRNPEIFERILKEGHRVGNHSLNHLNGWKYNDFSYVKNVLEAAQRVPSRLFRPPYGKIKRSQAAALKKRFAVIMWDVISGDFDHKISKEQCVENVMSNVEPGSIVVFHDSHKAWEKMTYALPIVLTKLREAGYSFGLIPEDIQPATDR
ncbi:MAG: polysaccharide deacetylase family protein [Cryomorphaceae bacterium]|nr:MAG: polysaccharide deacetylase family protein [Cryomorphaceae bacterium]